MKIFRGNIEFLNYLFDRNFRNNFDNFKLNFIRITLKT